MFQECFLRLFKGGFKIASSVFQGFLKVLRICQGYLIEAENLSPECSKDAEMFQKSFKQMLRLLEGPFKVVSRVFQKFFLKLFGEFQESFKDV